DHPWKTPDELTPDRLRALLAGAADYLPLAYREAYVRPLAGQVGPLLRSHDLPAEVLLNVETLAGAVYQHAEGHRCRPGVRQFLAVVSNYSRSFLSEAKRKAVAVPPAVDGLPPLATFRKSGSKGPFTFPAEVVRRLCGSSVPVVSLPERLRDHPVWWLTLAH